jgi:hypothetical protein
VSIAGALNAASELMLSILAPKGNEGALREDVELFAKEQKVRDFSGTTVGRRETVARSSAANAETNIFAITKINHGCENFHSQIR